MVSSIWTINEGIAVLDRLTRRRDETTKNPVLSNLDIQQIISTLVERIKSSSKDSSFRLVYLDHPIISDSRLLIKDIHLSADDAVHLFTSRVYDCNYFLVHDKHLIKSIPSKTYYNMRIIDLGDEKDRELLKHELNL